ncbi:RpiB/LacA/LacB family sugar-phosphate isomerase [Hungatella sp.]|uniref:RpiB/LacA/LacB family sugar-phosphate isomerase n=1 Tax=Hungatella sp. TaxID=2613924 RepID=UPI002A804C1F|nr:RpiB/LacA/LacB family sugar-phosphate isomerase [Hungatella sp.]
MRVTLINEFSQASKNALILRALEKSAAKYHVEWFNTGMRTDNDQPVLNYIHLGIQAFVLLNTGTVDFVITGCGSGQGACMSLNSYPGVNCGYITDTSDAYLFTQINNGNAVALPFAKDFGWAAELKLEDIFDKLFSCEGGGGYPVEMRDIQSKNGTVFNQVKDVLCKEPVDILKALDPEMVKTALEGEWFCSCFRKYAKPGSLTAYVKELIAEKPDDPALPGTGGHDGFKN